MNCSQKSHATTGLSEIKKEIAQCAKILIRVSKQLESLPDILAEKLNSNNKQLEALLNSQRTCRVPRSKGGAVHPTNSPSESHIKESPEDLFWKCLLPRSRKLLVSRYWNRSYVEMWGASPWRPGKDEVQKLAQATQDHFRSIRSLGTKTLRNIAEALKAGGFIRDEKLWFEKRKW